ncbi:MAG TPA: hypothetical protein VHC69_35455 [Polyangiaceae bacterium]|nr:hypothetical protein [Polyangiaceae bacterium]
MSRLVSTLSLDGDRVSADLVVHLKRPLSSATAESVADEIARAATEILGDEITQGELTFSKEELTTRVVARISASAAKATELEVKALYLFGSEANSNKSTYRTRPASVPPQPGASHKSGAIPAVTAGSTVPSPALTPPPAPRVRTLWPRALAACEPGTAVDRLGALLGPALRDSVAAAVLHAFVAIDPEVSDRMALFAGRGAIDDVLTEVAACFSSAAYRIFLAQDVDGSVASALVRAALRQVLATDEFPSELFAHYMGSESPVREMAVRLAACIGAPETAGTIQSSVSPYCEALRDDLLSVAAQVRKLVA